MRHRRRTTGREGYSPTAGLHFDDQKFESRLVWIWTTARSGSTWFLRMLCHPLKLVDSSKNPEDMLGFVAPWTWQGAVDVIPVDTTFVSNHLLPLAGAADYNEDLAPVTFSAALGLGKQANYFFSSRYEHAWRPEVRRMMLVRFHRFVERTAERYPVKSPLVLLKEVAGAHAAPLVMSMFPRSKFVFLVRDGRDVVDSQTAANQPGGWLPVSGWKTPEERREFINRRARTWLGDVVSIERAFEAHPPELRRMVRYEDLLADPSANLGPLVEWLGLRRSERWLERAIEANAFESIASEQKGPTKFFRSATPGAWRRNMSDEEAVTLEDVMGDKLRELGYPVGERVTDGSQDFNKKGQPDPDRVAEPEDATSEAESNVPNTESKSPFDVISATVRRAGEGRDFSTVGRLIQRRGGPASRRERKVALTFDDGPVLQTYRILETLERHSARGTFFLVGRKMDGHQGLIRRLLSGGHEIGNHSHGHFPFPAREDVAACSALIEHITGDKPKLFRPPYGAVDRPGAEAAIEDGMRVVLWSADSKDGIPPWKGIPADEVTRNVLGSVHPGAVVLLHDGLPWSSAADALPELIEGLQGEGYRLVTVSELLADPGAERLPPRHRRLRRLRRAVRGGDVPAPTNVVASPSDEQDTSGSPLEAERDGDPRERLAQLLETVAEDVEAPPEEANDGAAARLIRGACARLADPHIASDLLARYTAAHEVNAVRVIALGYSLRRFESDQGDSAPLAEQLSARLFDADDPGTEAGRIARELAGPTRVNRLVKARLAGQQDRASGGAAETAVDHEAMALAPRRSVSSEFPSIFGLEPELWDGLASWARETCRGVARRRMRALLDAAGVDGSFDIEALIERLDVDHLFRFGYALAACEEELSRA
jgi:peptidoglycan/xylan/chitin deacetylase (PgdA/CDA1 family)